MRVQPKRRHFNREVGTREDGSPEGDSREGYNREMRRAFSSDVTA